MRAATSTQPGCQALGSFTACWKSRGQLLLWEGHSPPDHGHKLLWRPQKQNPFPPQRLQTEQFSWVARTDPSLGALLHSLFLPTLTPHIGSRCTNSVSREV